MIPRAFIVCKINRIERMEFMLVEIIGKRYEEKLITTSLKVAEHFEKEHKNVIQAIENLTAENSAASLSGKKRAVRLGRLISKGASRPSIF